MNVTMKLHDIKADFDQIEVMLPGKYEVCPQCEGRGSTVNPAVDGNGLDANAFAEDPDFKEEYFAGVYDIPCPECHGKRVVAVPDVAACTYAQKRLLVSERLWQVAESEYRAEVRAEQRMMGIY
jgi:RecJ-like exonuclease